MKLPVWLKSLFKKETYLKEDGSLDVRKLLLRTFLLMLFIFGLYFIGLRYYRLSGWDQNVVVQQFIENFGVHGVAIYVFIVDLFVLPLSVDLMWPFVMEWHPALAILVMGASSVAGAFFLPTSLGDLSALFPSSGSGTQTVRDPHRADYNQVRNLGNCHQWIDPASFLYHLYRGRNTGTEGSPFLPCQSHPFSPNGNLLPDLYRSDRHRLRRDVIS